MDLESLPTRPPIPPGVLRDHEAAERTLLAAAVQYTKASDAIAAGRPVTIADLSTAESAYALLKVSAKAYGRAHAELVAAS